MHERRNFINLAKLFLTSPRIKTQMFIWCKHALTLNVPFISRNIDRFFLRFLKQFDHADRRGGVSRMPPANSEAQNRLVIVPAWIETIHLNDSFIRRAYDYSLAVYNPIFRPRFDFPEPKSWIEQMRCSQHEFSENLSSVTWAISEIRWSRN